MYPTMCQVVSRSDGVFLHLHERAFNKQTWAETRKV
jgi:hypothetical protein